MYNYVEIMGQKEVVTVEVSLQKNTGTSLIRRTGFIVLVLLILVTAGVLAGYFRFIGLLRPVAGQGTAQEVTVTVPVGANSSRIGEMLAAKGLIRSKTAFRIYAAYKNMDSGLQAGVYELSPVMSTQQVIARLAKGETSQLSFTIPEGYTVKQIADRLAEKKLVDRDKFLDIAANGTFNYGFLAGGPTGPARLEGFLFPDTYRVTKKTTEAQIIDMMLARFDKELKKQNLAGLAAKQGLTLTQAVTLASLVEREAKADEDRPKVAAVFLNRLHKGWKLESCATIQYALGQPKARLFTKDLQINSPYNTYKFTGLPPGPIAAPGSKSLLAAVNPAQVDYMFFVVSEDGRHVFSRTLKEHDRNRAIYLQKLSVGGQ